MIFRPAEDRDIDGLIDLWTRCGLTRPWNDPARDIAFARGKSNSEILVLEDSARIIASAMAGHDGHRGALYYVAVDPDHRCKGLGKAAVHAAEAWLKTRGVWKINLLVRTENAAILGFYKALGYEESAAISLGKWLNSPSPLAGEGGAQSAPDEGASPPDG